MLSIARIGSDASNYYKAEDYYLADKGQWGGSLSDELNLKGEVQKDDLENTLAGFDRDGGKLVKSAGTDSHRSGIDLTFSAPKSVGIEMLNNPEVFKVQNIAVDGVMNYIESELAQTRTYSGGKTSYEKTDSISYAKFMHMANRLGNPQLHTHTVLANMTVDKDGNIKTLSNETIFSNKHNLDIIYKNESAVGLNKIGYKTEITDPAHGSYELKGYDKELNKVFSERREEILERVKELRQDERYKGLDDRRIAEIANLQTRQPKSSMPAMQKEDLQRIVNETLKEHGTSLKEYSENLKNQTQEIKKPEIETVIMKTLESLHENNSAVTKTTLIAESMKPHIGVYSLKEYENGLDALREQGKIVELGMYSNRNGQQVYLASKEMIDSEKRVIQNAKDMQGNGGLNINKDVVDAHISKAEQDGFRYTSSQKDAIYKLAEAKDNLLVLQGDAGTGKTSSVYKTMAELAADSGYNVQGLTPTGVASNQLSSGAGIDSQTIDSFLARLENMGTPAAEKQLYIVDEASMISSSKMDRLISHVKENGDVVILGGDIKQFKPVGEGKIFEDIQNAGIKHAEVVDVVRQNTEHMIAIVEDFSRFYNGINLNQQDKTLPLVRALNEVDKQGNLHNEPDRDKRIDNAVRDYLDVVNSGKSSQIIVATNADKKDFNEAVRDELKKSGELKDGILVDTLRNNAMTQSKKDDVRFYQEGDVIRLNKGVVTEDGKFARGALLTVDGKNEKENLLNLSDSSGKSYSVNPEELGKFNVFSREQIELAAGDKVVFTNNKIESSVDGSDMKAIKNGTAGVVTELDKGIIGITTESGQTVRFSAKKDMLHVDHAYAQTLHKSQGGSYDVPIWVADTDRKINIDSAYVAVTRAKEDIVIYTGFSRADVEDRQQDRNLSYMDAVKEMFADKIAEENQKVSTLDDFKDETKEMDTSRDAFSIADESRMDERSISDDNGHAVAAEQDVGMEI